MIYWIMLTVLICIGLFDLYLYFTKQKTISQRVHQLFPKWMDIVIMCLLLGCIWWLFGGIKTFVLVMIGVIIGHLFWQE